MPRLALLGWKLEPVVALLPQEPLDPHLPGVLARCDGPDELAFLRLGHPVIGPRDPHLGRPRRRRVQAGDHQVQLALVELGHEHGLAARRPADARVQLGRELSHHGRLDAAERVGRVGGPRRMDGHADTQLAVLHVLEGIVGVPGQAAGAEDGGEDESTHWVHARAMRTRRAHVSRRFVASTSTPRSRAGSSRHPC